MPSGSEPRGEARGLDFGLQVAVHVSAFSVSSALARGQAGDGSKTPRVCCGRVPSRSGKGHTVTGPGRGSLGDELAAADPATRCAERLGGVLEFTGGRRSSQLEGPILRLFSLWDENPAQRSEPASLVAVPVDTRRSFLTVLSEPSGQVPRRSWGCTWRSATAPRCSATSSASFTLPTSREYPRPGHPPRGGRACPALRRGSACSTDRPWGSGSS